MRINEKAPATKYPWLQDLSERSVSLFGERVQAVFLFLLLLLTLSAYIPAIKSGFIWDDDRYPQNPVLTEPGGIKKIWSFTQTDQYYPLTFTSFWLERRLWGLEPAGYHTVNILLHIFNALLAWAILRKLKVPGAEIASLLFALHPVHVESVAWITERKNVLSTLFYLVSVLTYLRAEDWEDRASYWSAFAAFLLAMLAKTTAVTLPAILLLLHWYRGRPIDKRFLLKLTPFALVAAAFIPITIITESYYSGAAGFEYNISLPQRIIVSAHAVFFYLAKLVWPKRLVFNYEHWAPDASSALQWGWVALLAVVIALIWKSRRRAGNGPAAAGAFFLITIFPALAFFDIYPQRYSYVADHFQYLSSLGPIALAASMSTKAMGLRGNNRLNMTPGHMLIFAVVFSLLWSLSWHQAKGYRNSTVLWRTILVHNPASYLAHNNLGLELAVQGLTSDAIFHYKLALKAKPDFAEAHNNLGLAFFWSGRTDDAIAEYNTALRLRPTFADAKNNLGLALASKGRSAEAMQLYKKALMDRPDYALPYFNIGNILAKEGRLKEAIANYKISLSIWPDYPDANNNLANALANSGDTADAILYYKRALRAKPMLPMAHNNLANVLASQGNYSEAIEHYREALRGNPDFAEAHNNFGNALLAVGKTAEAVEHYRAAIKLRPEFKEAAGNLGIALSRDKDKGRR